MIYHMKVQVPDSVKSAVHPSIFKQPTEIFLRAFRIIFAISDLKFIARLSYSSFVSFFSLFLFLQNLYTLTSLSVNLTISATISSTIERISLRYVSVQEILSIFPHSFVFSLFTSYSLPLHHSIYIFLLLTLHLSIIILSFSHSLSLSLFLSLVSRISLPLSFFPSHLLTIRHDPYLSQQ